MSEEEENEIAAVFNRLPLEKAQEVVEFFKEYLNSKLLRKQDYPHVLKSLKYLISLIEEREKKEREEARTLRERENRPVYSSPKKRWRDCLEQEKEKERVLIQSLLGQRICVPAWEWRGTTGRRNRKGTCEQQFGCFWDD